MTWKVIEDHITAGTMDGSDERKVSDIGLKEEVLTELKECEDNMIASTLFLKLMFGDNIEAKITVCNVAVQNYNNEMQNTRDIKSFTKDEFLQGVALMIGAACYGVSGSNLWQKKSKDGYEYEFISIEPTPNFNKYMAEYRFREFR